MKHARSDYNRIQDLAEVVVAMEAEANKLRRNGLFEDARIIIKAIDFLESRYGRLDNFEPIPVDEPVFLLRAKDVTSPSTVRHWSMLADQAGAGECIVTAALAQASRMSDWQKIHPPQTPDMPEQGPCVGCGLTTHIKQGEVFVCSPECAGG